MDVAVTGGQVLALTRVGVLATDAKLTRWHRDPRFPAGVKLLATGPGPGVWAVTAAGIWRVGTSVGLVAALPEGAAIDVVSPAADVAVVAMRGTHAGVWRVEAHGEKPALVQVLAGVDPWSMAVDGATVWLGTLDAGVWVSHDAGKTFAAEKALGTGTVSTVAVIDKQPWVGWSDGRVTHGATGALACTVKAGPPIALARVAGKVLSVVDSQTGPLADLYRCGPDAVAVAIPSPTIDDDPDPIQPTGLWPLDAGRALLGTFRSGPLLATSAGLTAARTGFAATLGAKAMMEPDGAIAIALMSTGVYVSPDEGVTWSPVAPAGVGGPVTDTMDMLYQKGRMYVDDFDGITIGSGAKWYRSTGVAEASGGRPNAIIGIAMDDASRLWGRTYSGQLYRQDGAAWTECAASNVVRVEGSGDHVVVATTTGYFRADPCTAPLSAAWPDVPAAATAKASATRSDGHWLATPGQLWLDGKAVATLPAAAVEALSASDPGADATVIVALRGGDVVTCRAGACAVSALPLPGPASAIGAFADGRLWALEEKGSLLTSDAAGGSPGPTGNGSLIDARPAPQAEGTHLGGATEAEQLRIPPWRGVGRPGFRASSAQMPAPLGSKLLPTDATVPKEAVIPGATLPDAPLPVTPLGVAASAPRASVPPLSNTTFWEVVEGAIVAGLGAVALWRWRGGSAPARRGRRRR